MGASKKPKKKVGVKKKKVPVKVKKKVPVKKKKVAVKVKKDK